MPMGYCFYCDQTVDGDTCPTCGRSAWHGDTTDQTIADLAITPTPPESPNVPWRPKPWMIAGTVVVVGLVLSILTVPSGFQQVTTPTPPPVTTTTSTTIPRPGASLPTYPLPKGTWLGLIGTEVPPKTLTATFPFLEPADDVMYDGSLLIHTSDSYVRVTPDGLHTDLPMGSPARFVDVALSPDGRSLATVDTRATVTVWDLTTNEAIEMEAVPVVDALADGHIYWAPNSVMLGLDAGGEQSFEWLNDGTLLAGPLPGRLVAVGSTHMALAVSDGLNLTNSITGLGLGTVELGNTRSTISEIQAGAFDPTGRYLAIDATIAGQGQGVWVIDLNDPRQDLVAPSGSVFTWSGDGSALYWTDTTGTFAFPISSGYRVASVSNQKLHLGDRLRVYDPALVAAPSLLVRSSDLFELRDGQIGHRSPSGLAVLDPHSGGTTTSIVDSTSLNPDLPLLRTVEYEGDGTLALQLTTTGLIEQLVGDLSGYGPVTSVLNAPGYGEFLAADPDGVFRLGPEQTLDPVMEGWSPGIIGTVPFAVTSTSIERLPRDGGEPETLLGATGLAGTADILDAVGIRSEMVILTRSLVGTAGVYWVPGDSTLFGTAILPNSPLPNPTPFSLVYTPTNDRTFETGWIVPAEDGQTFALALRYTDGIETVVMTDPNPGQSTCGGQVVCQHFSFEGRPLGFSPDGAWLLADIDGEYYALSTKGRGSVRFDEAPPDEVTWIP